MPYGTIAKSEADAKQKKWARPLPEVQLYARITGGVQFQCPDCGNLNGTCQEVWRRARVKCRRCKHKFRVGVGFTVIEGSYMAMGQGTFNGYCVNRIEPPYHYPWNSLVGRVVGAFEYNCPECGKAHTVKLDWGAPRVTCCKTWFVQLLLWAPSRAPNSIICPIDWIIDARSTETSIPAEEVSQSTGSPS